MPCSVSLSVVGLVGVEWAESVCVGVVRCSGAGVRGALFEKAVRSVFRFRVDNYSNNR